ncbi:hypothetical protein Vafri_16263, partial [Volvox africanus]
QQPFLSDFNLHCKPSSPQTSDINDPSRLRNEMRVPLPVPPPVLLLDLRAYVGAANLGQLTLSLANKVGSQQPQPMTRDDMYRTTLMTFAATHAVHMYCLYSHRHSGTAVLCPSIVHQSAHSNIAPRSPLPAGRDRGTTTQLPATSPPQVRTVCSKHSSDCRTPVLYRTSAASWCSFTHCGHYESAVIS